MKAKIIFMLFIIMVAANVVRAQFPASKYHHDDKPADTTDVVILTKEQLDAYQRRPAKDANNIIKIGTLYWGTGVFPIYYERRISTILGLQAGIGITARDFVADLVNLATGQGGLRSYNFTGNNDVEDDYWDYSHRKVVAGVYLSLQPKFYLVDNALQGFFISPAIEYKRYNWRAQMLDPTQNEEVYLPGSWMHEYRNAFDFTANFGGQWLLGKHLAIEYSGGIGLRRFFEVRQDLGTDLLTGDYINAVRNYNGFRPEIMMNLNIGGFF